MNTPDIARMDAARIGAPDPEIVALEARLRAAQLGADVGALESLISDDLLFTGPDGQLATKRADLEAHASGAIRFRAHEPKELQIRRVGTDVAVTALRAWLAVEVGGTLVEGPVRYTRIWGCEADGVWRVVAGHVSVLSPASAGGTADASDSGRRDVGG